MSLIPLSDLSIFSFITAWSLLLSVLLKLELGGGETVHDFTFLKMNNLDIWLEGRLFCVSICPGWTAYLKLSAGFSLLALPSCFSLGLSPVSSFLKTVYLLLEQQSSSAAHFLLYFEGIPKEKWQEMEVSFNFSTIAVTSVV